MVTASAASPYSIHGKCILARSGNDVVYSCNSYQLLDQRRPIAVLLPQSIRICDLVLYDSSIFMIGCNDFWFLFHFPRARSHTTHFDRCMNACLSTFVNLCVWRKNKKQKKKTNTNSVTDFYYTVRNVHFDFVSFTHFNSISISFTISSNAIHWWCSTGRRCARTHRVVSLLSESVDSFRLY